MNAQLKREFVERREQERRKASNAAIAHHFAECQRADIERRRSNTQKLVDWKARFDAARY